MSGTRSKTQAAQELFIRLAEGDIRGYGGAEFMASDIRKFLKDDGKTVKALDPHGEKTVEQMEGAIDKFSARAQMEKAQELFIRLVAGDTHGYGATKYISADISEKLKKITSLDPTKAEIADQMKAVLKKIDLAAKYSIGSNPGRTFSLN